ncbi:MAG: 5'/3'-nucleotidase SurE [Caulobacterales bacterium]|nr:5'/3'-nucleotidase SurE [Caulobacterales bacterium]
MFPANPRILVSNDDGIDAAGIAVLEAVAAELSEDVWVAAPEHEQSGASRKLSLTEPVQVREAGSPRRFAVNGTPSDAVFLGLHDLVEGKRPDLVLSGVNRGQNLAEDVTVSGTIAAAMQAMQIGVPAIALSQSLQTFTMKDDTPFETARALAPKLLRDLLKDGWPDHVVININFPPCKAEEVRGVVVTRQGARDQWHMHAERRTDLRERTYYWLGFRGQLSNPAPGDDLHAVYNNYISVTPLRLDLTDEPARALLADRLGAKPAA